MPDQSNRAPTLDLNFVQVIELLNEHSISYWVCHGTLLGLVRDGKLIPWDGDIDIAIWAGSISKPTLIELMERHGYRLKSDGADYDFVGFSRPGGREVDFNYYRISQDSELAYSEWFIPETRIVGLLELVAGKADYAGKWSRCIKQLYFMSSIANIITRVLKKNGWCYKSGGYTTPIDLLNEFDFIEISGVKVRVPREYEAVLKFVYGSEWRIPKKHYDWTKESPATRISKSRFT